MKKDILLIIIIYFCSINNYLFPQTFEGNLILASQSQVNSFNYTKINGSLEIHESAAGSITNLNGLSELTQVTKGINIYGNTSLNNLSGLSGLTIIGSEEDGNLAAGSLLISNNSALVNLNGLSNIRTITGDLNISNNNKLKNIDGLSGLAKVGSYTEYLGAWGGRVTISNNSQLENLDGFASLGYIVIGLTINNNDALTNILGLSHLSGFYYFQFSGPSNGFIIIEDNAVLKNLDGLNISQLDQVYINNNASLENINALSSLSLVGHDVRFGPFEYGPTSIINNASLTQFCGLFTLLSGTDNHGDINITGNAVNPGIFDILNSGPCSVDVLITSQAEINSFQLQHVTGNLTIKEKTPGNIRSLNGLSELTSVTGSLFIDSNSALKDLAGLDNLTHVKNLAINNNNSLITLNALKNLSSIDELVFADHHDITYTSPGNLIITNNPSLINLDGLLKISAVNYLVIIKNDALKNIDGIKNIGEVGNRYKGQGFEFVWPGTITIRDNNSLLNVDGLAGIYAASTLEILYNTSLIDIKGISGIYLLGGATYEDFYFSNVNIAGNTALTNLCPLYGLIHSESEFLTLNISGNGSDVSGLKPCPFSFTGDVVLTSQQQVDDFNYKNIIGNLTVKETVRGNITNLRALSVLDSITGKNAGSLKISGLWGLKNLEGLENLKKTGSLIIENNRSLASLNALSNLSSVEQSIYEEPVEYKTPGVISILNNPSLIKLDGLSGITVTGYLNIINNDALKNLDGLSSLKEVSRLYLDLFYNGNKQGGNIRIEDNASLLNINALSKIKELTFLSIKNNSSLIDISALGNLYLLGFFYEWFYPGRIYIQNNGSLLNFCSLYKLVTTHFEGVTFRYEDIITISGNGANPAVDDIKKHGPCITNIVMKVMDGKFSGDARLGTMRGSVSQRAVYFQGTGGGVNLKVDVPPSPREWFLWGRMYYNSTGGKNSFYVTANGFKQVIGDNDYKYDQWHWDGCNGARLNLGIIAPGEHSIIISGREPGLTLWIDEIILTDDSSFVPEGFTSSASVFTLNAMQGILSGDARLGTMHGSINSRPVYFQGFSGGLTFKVNLPASSRNWYLWGRMYYNTSGGKNSFFVTVNSTKYILGDNDLKYDQWHWDGYNGAKINTGILSPGENIITVSAREPGLTLWLDQLILTDDASFIPFNFSGTTSRIYLNCMNGLLTGDAILGTMRGSVNSRPVYFRGPEGGITFRVNTSPSPRTWYVWGRMYCMSSGGKNSFFITVNGVKQVLGDNDSKYDQWFWDGNYGNKINLGVFSSGEQVITVSGREPGLTLWIDQLLLTDDPDLNPDILARENPGKDTLLARQNQIPEFYQLSNNYPNPFNSATTINFALPAPAEVNIDIFDITGRLVRKLISGEVAEGYHDVTWDGKNNFGEATSTGIYFVYFSAKGPAGSFIKQVKIVQLK